jgi:hypothetical protein
MYHGSGFEMHNEPLPDEPATPTDTPGKPRQSFPLLRLGLFTLFILTLPFTWGETSSCNGPSRTFTGFEHATRDAGNTIAFVVIFSTPVLLAFLVYFTRTTWIRLGFESIAAMFSSFGTFYCFISAVITGDITHKSSRAYPAPWVATIAMLLMTLDTFRGVVKESKALWQVWQANKDLPKQRQDTDSV